MISYGCRGGYAQSTVDDLSEPTRETQLRKSRYREWLVAGEQAPLAAQRAAADPNGVNCALH